MNSEQAEGVVMTPKEKDCGCIGEFHAEGCKCTCTDYRKDALCMMHINAAESLPAQPAPMNESQMVLAIGRQYPTMSIHGPAESTGGQWSVFSTEWKNHRIGWGNTRESAIAMAYTYKAAAPVESLPVETKEKERCEFCWFFVPNHAPTCFHRHAEPKPTLPEPVASEQNCAGCNRPKREHRGDVYLYCPNNSGSVYCVDVSEPQSSLSSIPAQTFEEWWKVFNKSECARAALGIGTEKAPYGSSEYFILRRCAEVTWNAAKGSK